MSDFIADTNLGHTTDLNSMKAAPSVQLECTPPIRASKLTKE